MGLHHAPLFLFVIFGSFLQTTQDNPPITVESCQHTDVLLECNCSKMTDGLKWQKDQLIYSDNIIMENYTDRIKMFLNETPKNRSILLKNITEEDGGDYKCNFYEEVYSRSTVTLQVNMNSTQCSVHGTTERVISHSTDRPVEYFAFIIIPALLLFGCIFLLLRKRRNQLHNKQKGEPVARHFFPPLIIRPDMDQEPERQLPLL
ncbi:uncharacterized protein LOC114147985 [Xiphophorus couchianus]|uniref:uncharacterized protein LOC114147985 n=1 Tax=Xiphophorus couchianus TaxID=32473 RepID=UPI001015CAFC|nr:uncharacterized protein LOC114147985 [Xiphophorus couchianus]